jgi:AraC family transcriptional regulator
LSLVLRGHFEESVGRDAALARSASVVVMPRGVSHAERMGPLGARSITIVLRSPFLEESSCDSRQLKTWKWFHGGGVARIMLRAYQEWLLADAAAEFGLSELLVTLPEAIDGERDCKAGDTRRCVEAAADLLHARGGRDVRLADVAIEVGKDPAYLARAFRQRMGCTMSQYRRRLWVREAAHLLASTDLPLSQVAMTVGFADQSHLCRVFKAELGQTPQNYRLLAGAG